MAIAGRRALINPNPNIGDIFCKARLVSVGILNAMDSDLHCFRR
jgi:hypothetical protein